MEAVREGVLQVAGDEVHGRGAQDLHLAAAVVEVAEGDLVVVGLEDLGFVQRPAAHCAG
jgi:hypothetical protein